MQVNTGVDIETGSAKDLSSDGIMDLYATKWWAVKLATDAVITVLKVDQIIMAKQVSGLGEMEGWHAVTCVCWTCWWLNHYCRGLVDMFSFGSAEHGVARSTKRAGLLP